jgi:hypothetical protein
MMLTRARGWFVHAAWPAAPVALGMAHFYLMELRPGPYKGRLGIRPFAYTAFAAGVAGVAYVVSRARVA